MAVKKKASKKKVSKKKTTSKKKSSNKKLSKEVKVKVNATNINNPHLKIVHGRPRTISSPKEMDRLVDEYILKCSEVNEPLLLTGMILYLGLSSRESFDHYGRDHVGYSDSVKRAKMLIECGYEYRLHGTTPTGSIFALKNFGWKDKQEDSPEDETPEPTNMTFHVAAPITDKVKVTKGK